jgi:HPt (histidine-containing phosphotransfer) domain-containing protein
MNGYLSKTIDAALLNDALNRCVNATQSTVPAEQRHPTQRLFDASELLARAGDDPTFMRELILVFAEFAADNISRLRTAVGQGDAVQIRLLAHGMKGAAANIAVPRLAHHAEVLEKAADHAAAARTECAALESLLEETLAEWRRSGWLAEEGSNCGILSPPGPMPRRRDSSC